MFAPTETTLDTTPLIADASKDTSPVPNTFAPTETVFDFTPDIALN